MRTEKRRFPEIPLNIHGITVRQRLAFRIVLPQRQMLLKSEYRKDAAIGLMRVAKPPNGSIVAL